MKKVQYRISRGELFGLLDEGDIVDAYVLLEGCDGESLLYIPKDKKRHDDCASVCVAYPSADKIYVGAELSYVNLAPKDVRLISKLMDK